VLPPSRVIPRTHASSATDANPGNQAAARAFSGGPYTPLGMMLTGKHLSNWRNRLAAGALSASRPHGSII
jgi:hypothetical protein